jgi:hypothetical protein
LSALLDLLRSVSDLKKGDRAIDRRIALFIGYREQQGKAPAWVDPDGGPASAQPYFTSSTDHAALLQIRICPNKAFGVSWDEHGGYAKVGDSQPVHASTTALALTAALLAELLKQQKG